jgi:hypothetical protein
MERRNAEEEEEEEEEEEAEAEHLYSVHFVCTRPT